MIDAIHFFNQKHYIEKSCLIDVITDTSAPKSTYLHLSFQYHDLKIGRVIYRDVNWNFLTFLHVFVYNIQKYMQMNYQFQIFIDKLKL